MRTTLRRLLRLAAFEVTAFASGDDFLASLSVSRPTCAIVDVHMPGLSGFELQERLRAAHIRIPVVLITASNDTGLDRLASEAGVVCLLRKPFTSETLLEAVDMAIKTLDGDT